MKNSIYLLLFGLVISFSSCVIIPDLDPNTPSGSAITVININDTIPIPYGYGGYDLNGNGFEDIQFLLYECDILLKESAFSVQVTGGEILTELNPLEFFYSSVKAVGSNNIGINALSTFGPVGAIFKFDATYNSFPFFEGCTISKMNHASPTGKNYIMFKVGTGSDLRYGWIEYYSTITKVGSSGIFVVKKVGIANETGLVLRAGQEEL